MIKFVFNGYYRSGTTIFYRILKKVILTIYVYVNP